jgi:hypothetical protein
MSIIAVIPEGMSSAGEPCWHLLQDLIAHLSVCLDKPLRSHFLDADQAEQRLSA